MTDKEIIKALECCSGEKACYDCPLYVEIEKVCTATVASEALKLIKFQQERIEDLEILTGLQRKRKYYNKFVKEVWQKEHGKLSYPDFDEIYKRYFEQQERFDRIIEQVRLYFIEQCELRVGDKEEYPLGLISDLLSHNKKICQIIESAGSENYDPKEAENDNLCSD